MTIRWFTCSPRLLSAALALAFTASAHASAITYTFTGSAAGTIDDANGGLVDTFSSFTLTFVTNTTLVDPSGAPYYRINDITGTFTSGLFTETLPDVTIVVNSAAGPVYQNVNFFNAAFNDGLGLLDNAALLGYTLTTNVDTGVASGGSLSPTLNGGSFADSGGGTVTFTGDTTLEFTAQVPSQSPVPEPPSSALLATGLSGLAMFYRRLRRER